MNSLAKTDRWIVVVMGFLVVGTNVLILNTMKVDSERTATLDKVAPAEVKETVLNSHAQEMLLLQANGETIRSRTELLELKVDKILDVLESK